MAVRKITRWSTNIDEIGWRQAWGLFDQIDRVGFLYLASRLLRSELHRVFWRRQCARTKSSVSVDVSSVSTN
jgi:hypothetical protein